MTYVRGSGSFGVEQKEGAPHHSVFIPTLNSLDFCLVSLPFSILCLLPRNGSFSVVEERTVGGPTAAALQTATQALVEPRPTHPSWDDWRLQFLSFSCSGYERIVSLGTWHSAFSSLWFLDQLYIFQTFVDISHPLLLCLCTLCFFVSVKHLLLLVQRDLRE